LDAGGLGFLAVLALNWVKYIYRISVIHRHKPVRTAACLCHSHTGRPGPENSVKTLEQALIEA
jgi:hypothetical protein